VFDFDEVVSRVVRCSQWHSSGFNTWACFVHYLHQWLNRVMQGRCHGWINQSKMVQARITKSLPSAAWKTLVSETVKIFFINSNGVTSNKGT